MTYRLVESYRTPNGPRHRTILNLGTLDLTQEDRKRLADRIESIVNGGQDLFAMEVGKEVEALAQHYAKLLINKDIEAKGTEVKFQEDGETEKDYHMVDVNSIESGSVKQIGAEIVSLHGFEQLGFVEILQEAGFNKKETALATLAIVGRLVHPDSDLSTVKWAREISGIDELIGADFRKIGKNALYGISEKLYENKEVIDGELQQREGALFSLDRKIILYDLTNTYFEGTGRHSELAKYGRSKEKRTDCPLVTLGFVIGPGISACKQGIAGESK